MSDELRRSKRVLKPTVRVMEQLETNELIRAQEISDIDDICSNTSRKTWHSHRTQHPQKMQHSLEVQQSQRHKMSPLDSATNVMMKVEDVSLSLQHPSISQKLTTPLREADTAVSSYPVGSLAEKLIGSQQQDKPDVLDTLQVNTLNTQEAARLKQLQESMYAAAGLIIDDNTKAEELKLSGSIKSDNLALPQHFIETNVDSHEATKAWVKEQQKIHSEKSTDRGGDLNKFEHPQNSEVHGDNHNDKTAKLFSTRSHHSKDLRHSRRSNHSQASGKTKYSKVSSGVLLLQKIEAEMRDQYEELQESLMIKEQEVRLAMIKDDVEKNKMIEEEELRLARIKDEVEKNKMIKEEELRLARIKDEAKIGKVRRKLEKSQLELMAASSTAGSSLSCSHLEPVQQSVRCEKFDNPVLEHHRTSRLVNNVPPPTATDNSYTTLQMAQIAKMFSDSINVSRLPIPEPPVFTGDPLKFNSWMSAFSILIESKGIPPLEKIHYMKRYLGGDAREFVEGVFDLNDECVYDTVKSRLTERYGSSFLVTEAFRSKLESWPKIGSGDGVGLRKFGDFLQQCLIASRSVKSLSILNDCRENRKMLMKLPDDIVYRWSRRLHGDQDYPNFETFVHFISREADILCNPITNLNDFQNEQNTRTHVALANGSAEIVICLYCVKKYHSLHDCRIFMKKTAEERIEFLRKNELCFSCLKIGHISRSCSERSQCKKCKRKHPTCLHDDWKKPKQKPDETYETGNTENAPEEQTVNTEESQDVPESMVKNTQTIESKPSTQTSMTVPVYVSIPGKEEDEVLLYCVLDTQSDTSFITEDTAKRLNINYEVTALKLSTLTSTSRIQCMKFTDLQVRGINESTPVALPSAYSREHIPLTRSHIPTAGTARTWPHLKSLENQIPDLLDIEVGILIGYNCPQALAPRAVICGNHDEPFAQKTDLGWSIVGSMQPSNYSIDTHVIHRVDASVTEGLYVKNENIPLHGKLAHRASCKDRTQLSESNVLEILHKKEITKWQISTQQTFGSIRWV